MRPVHQEKCDRETQPKSLLSDSHEAFPWPSKLTAPQGKAYLANPGATER